MHVGAGAEGNPQNVSHSASAGESPLSARQMTIAWTVVGGKGDRDLRIPERGAGTGRAALGPSALPPGVAAMAPETSGPPRRASAKACNCKGAPGQRSMNAGSSGPGPRGSSGPGGVGGTPGGGPRLGGDAGGGGGPPSGGGLGRPLGPGGLNMLPPPPPRLRDMLRTLPPPHLLLPPLPPWCTRCPR